MSFGDLYTVPAGTPQDPNLPPIDLPRVEAAPRPAPRTRLTVTPDTTRPPDDPFAGLKEWSGEPAKKEPQGDPFGDLKAWEPSKPAPVTEDRANRDIGGMEGGMMGAREGVTFGAYPNIHGVISAGKTEAERGESEEDYIRRVARNPVGALGNEVGSAVHGLYKLFTDPKSRKIYEDERAAAQREQESAEAQNPAAYLGGQLAGSLIAPVPGMGAAAEARAGVGLFERALKRGVTGGALYGGGSELGRGKDLGDIAEGAGTGAVAGGAAGVLGEGTIRGGGTLLGKGRDIVQGAVNPSAVARRRYGQALDTARRTDTMGLEPHEYAQALTDQMPVHGVDIGGNTTRDLARTISNVSPEARQIIGKPLAERQEERTQRFTDRVYRIMGGTLDRGADRKGLSDLARIWNAPRYKRAYIAGDRPIGTDPEMQRLMGSDIVQTAMKKAVSTGKDRAIRERQGAFNPGVSVTPDGRLVFASGPRGVPTYPNIQYWDYVQRELRDMAEKAGTKSPSRASLINGLRGDLNKVLDDEVPEFAAARAGAAKFFKAKDAVEAGENFALGKADFKDVRDAQRAIARFSGPEQELFARSVMDTITEALKDKPDWGTIKRLFTSPRAMEKIEAAIGPARARELEVGLRAETMARATEERLFGNSSSVRQAIDAAKYAAGTAGGHAAGGAGAVAAYEALKEGHVDPKHLIAAALTFGLVRGGVRHIDHQVVTRLAEMLASEDPAVARRAMQTVARSPTLFKALRAGTEAGARVTAHNLGLSGMGAGMAVLYNEAMREGEPEQQGADDQSVIDQHAP